jgi:hypothetical protein
MAAIYRQKKGKAQSIRSHEERLPLNRYEYLSGGNLVRWMNLSDMSSRPGESFENRVPFFLAEELRRRGERMTNN